MSDEGDIIINARVDIKTSGKDKAKKDIQDVKNEAQKAVRDVTATARLPRGRDKVGIDEPEHVRTNNNVSTREFEKAASKIEKSIDKFSRIVDRIDSKVYAGTETPNDQVPPKYREIDIARVAAEASLKARSQNWASNNIKNELTGTTSHSQRVDAAKQASDIYRNAGMGEAGLRALDAHIAHIRDMQKQSGFPTYMIPMMQGAKDTLAHVKMKQQWMGKVIQERVNNKWVKKNTGFMGGMATTRTSPATAAALGATGRIEGEDVVGTDLDETLKNINPFAWLFAKETDNFTKMSPKQYGKFAKTNRDHPQLQELARHLAADNAVVMSARIQPWLRNMGDAQAASLGIFETVYSKNTEEKIQQIIKRGITTFLEDDPITAKRLREGLAQAGHYGTNVMHTDQYLASKTGTNGFDLKSMVHTSPQDVINNLRGLIKQGSNETSVTYDNASGKLLGQSWGQAHQVPALSKDDAPNFFRWLRESGDAGLTIAHQHPNGGVVPSFRDVRAYHRMAAQLTGSERAKFNMGVVGAYGHTSFRTDPSAEIDENEGTITSLLRSGDYAGLKKFGIHARFFGPEGMTAASHQQRLADERRAQENESFATALLGEPIDRSKLGPQYANLTDAEIAAMQVTHSSVTGPNGEDWAVSNKKGMKGKAAQDWLEQHMASLRGGVRERPEGAHMPGGVPPAARYRGFGLGTLNEWGGTFAKQFKNYMYRSPEDYEAARKDHLMKQIEAQQGSELFTPTYLYGRGMNPAARAVAGRFYKSRYKITIPYADSAAGASVIEQARGLPGARGYTTGDKSFQTALGEQQMHGITIHGEMSDEQMVRYQDRLREFSKAAAKAGGTRGSPQLELTTKTSREVQRYSLAHDMAAVSVAKLTRVQRALFMGQMQALGLYFSTQSIMKTFQNTLQTITTPLSSVSNIFKDIGLGIAFGKKGSKSVEFMKGMLTNTQGIVSAWKNFQGAQATVQAGFAKLAVTLFSNDIFMERLYQIIDKFFETVSDQNFIDNILSILESIIQALPTIIEEIKWFVGTLKQLTELPAAIPIIAGILAVGYAAQFAMGFLAALSAGLAGLKGAGTIIAAITSGTYTGTGAGIASTIMDGIIAGISALGAVGLIAAIAAIIAIADAYVYDVGGFRTWISNSLADMQKDTTNLAAKLTTVVASIFGGVVYSNEMFAKMWDAMLTWDKEKVQKFSDSLATAISRGTVDALSGKIGADGKRSGGLIDAILDSMITAITNGSVEKKLGALAADLLLGIGTAFWSLATVFADIVKGLIDGICTALSNGDWSRLSSVGEHIGTIIANGIISRLPGVNAVIGFYQESMRRGQEAADYRGAITRGTYYQDPYTGVWKARASGGPVSAGQTYIVGEEGPELFTAMASGHITPNNKASKELTEIGGANQQFNQTINIGSVNNAADLDRLLTQMRQQSIYGQRPLSG